MTQGTRGGHCRRAGIFQGYISAVFFSAVFVKGFFQRYFSGVFFSAVFFKGIFQRYFSAVVFFKG
jgi:hypothetical protein